MAGVRVIMRPYFSSYLLWTAQDASGRARRIEANHSVGSRFDIAHRACVLTAVLSAAAFLEAVANELFQDAHDSHGTAGDGYIAPLTEATRKRLAQIWASTEEGMRLRPLDKYQLLLTSGDCPPLDKGDAPYQSAQLVVQLRNAIAHYQPEDLAADAAAKMERRLRGKFADNPLMEGAGNPWWPDKALGHGCAEWAHTSVVALTDRVTSDLGLVPNYKRLSTDGWAGFGSQPA